MRRKAVTTAVFLALAALTFAHGRLASSAAPEPTGDPQRRAQSGQTRQPQQTARRDYSHFSHSVPEHAKQKCDACHKFPSANWKDVRKGKDAFPDVTEYPEHASCIGCHKQQFFARERPAPSICSNCHVGVTPSFTARKPYPNPRETFDASPFGSTVTSEFGINFAHDKHVDLVGQLRRERERERVRFVTAAYRPEGEQKEQKKEEAKKEEPKETSDPKSCAVCHQTYMPQGDAEDEFVTRPPKNLPDDAFWLKKGTFKTSPGHSTCFSCHNADAGITPAQSDCNACHKLIPPSERLDIARAHDDYDPALAARMGVADKYTLERWSRRGVARFRHEWLPHQGLSCTACHDVNKMNTLDRSTLRVAVKSCGGGGTGCHVEQTNEGILNELVSKKRADPAFVCAKCHTLNGARALPESHVEALPGPTPTAKKD
ncbi:MAG TPA: cytochrome c3 family protein [Pyrinomonadaceae bacterium]|nr:cytochrome c3 family protein [Pyrinomonadaceae bacterium]